MLTFSELTYVRPDLNVLETSMHAAIDRLREATDVDTANNAISEINTLRNQFETASQLVEIRHTIDTRDGFYETEQGFFDEAGPVYQGYVSSYYQALTTHPLRSSLESTWGKQLFLLAEASLKTFSDEIIPKLQEENRLASEYTKLMSAAQIEFDGKTLNLSQFGPYLQSADRTVRKAASEARYGYLKEHGDAIDTIYDKLVHVRTDIAKTLGFPSFVELGYARMLRVDYDQSMVENYREQILETIVPIATSLKERQQRRIGVDSLYYYDEGFAFKTGNATPQGEEAFIIEGGKKMYRDMSPETNEFFEYMLERGALDLTAKPGKAGGGYCTYIADEKLPFIFSNFNGTAGDIDVLTHEVGHAFQVYESRHFTVPEYGFPTYEACEIHSMSMEYFAYPWMEEFFGDQTAKYKFSHLAGGVTFLPYGVAIDEFQHVIYNQPELTPAERRTAWRDIEKKYLPHRNYEENDYLDSGAWWHQQGHVFGSPFYYIDYTLAQVCAFQFYAWMEQDREAAWKSYLELCKAGGSESFLTLVERAGLKSPFAPGTVGTAVEPIKAYLSETDDLALDRV
ncbi:MULTISPECIES: M3 family oligoendopeptidase [Exiguobacterium]|uniref:Oligoendopeptidase, M3 family n=1 Tax=Exiguobacterium sibiricum (strain DSM 17290 / CCUG 55495 / CIP 109462 / JCM 13490 / 255-15) TaxID=262543 RepID=B1YLZ0_EXIS2|nr:MULTISPECIES: M3 family oligoendopeptidase [Exiguobacterium]ACB61948.1 oligoendopeptidase, M3 family [Exiguobacterium sibiricum 255-15]MCT4793449.1 M3 family oligoendopeptidase [Exiguobacterium artemiae]